MSLTLLPMEDFLKMFHPEVHEKIKKATSHVGVSHVVCFENHDMWSPHLGERSAVIVGPRCTYSFEDVQKPGARIGDVPSRFKYPVAYAVVPKKKARRTPAAKARRG